MFEWVNFCIGVNPYLDFVVGELLIESTTILMAYGQRLFVIALDHLFLHVLTWFLNISESLVFFYLLHHSGGEN